MGQRFCHLLIVNLLLLLVLNLITNHALSDQVKTTMDNFSGYPPIDEEDQGLGEQPPPHFSNPQTPSSKSLNTHEAQQIQTTEDNAQVEVGSTFNKAKDVISGILAKGYVLGKDAINKAKALDEQHQLISTTTAKVVAFDKKIGLTEKVTLGTSLVSGKVREVDEKHMVSEKVKSACMLGTSVVNDKVRDVDQKLQVSEKVKSALTSAEQAATSAKSTVMKNQYVSIGASWVAGAFSKVAKVAGEIGQLTKEKVEMAEEGQRKVDLSESSK